MKLTYLSAADEYPLTKSYTKEPDGTMSSRPYPRTFRFTSHVELVNSIEDFLETLRSHSAAGHCLLKGNLTRAILGESRAGLSAQEHTGYICLDFDGLDLKGRSLDQVLHDLGLGDVDYILQYSSSQGLKDGFYAHVFMMLDRPQSPEHLKRWLKNSNMTVPFLADQLALTPTNMAIHWTLDITTCQNDKLLYVAPPVLTNIEDPFPDGRIILNKRERKFAYIPDITRDVDNAARDLLKNLRAKAGCEVKEYKYKFDADTGHEVLQNPDAMSITGMRTARGWTYLNINGSTSWGYFHRTDNPKVIGNFRGEPYYLTKDINPAYYKEALDRARTAKNEAHRPSDHAQPAKWVINDRSDGRYYKVSYTPEVGVELSPAPSIKHLEDYCKLNNIPFPDAIPDWDVVFDPTQPAPFNSDERWINTYRPTEYRVRSMNKFAGPLKAAALADPNVGKIPHVYELLIKHVCGGDQIAADRFTNWLAYIWQTGRKAKTAWVLHGTYGTGKGRLLKVLQALLGDHCIMTTAEQVNEAFNGNIKTAMILWIDEVTTDSWDNEKVTPKLRQWIDGDEVPIREMRKDWNAKSKNFMSIIVAANEHNPVEIRLHDRRWNVAPRQEIKLKHCTWATAGVLDDDVGELYQEDNLQAFADALYLYPTDIGAVRDPLENEAKNDVMRVTQSLPQDIVDALQKGHTSFFLEFVSNPTAAAAASSIDTMEYRMLVERMMQGGRQPFKTSEIATLFKHLAGWNQPNAKFVKAASKFGLNLSGRRCRINGQVTVGEYFTFFPTEDDKALWAQLAQPKLSVVKEDKTA